MNTPAKAILVHAGSAATARTDSLLRDHLAALETLPRRALSLPSSDAPAPSIAAFVELWGTRRALRAAIAEWPEPAAAWLVDEFLPADAPRTWPSGQQSPGVRLVSSVFRRPELDRAAFAHHWRTRHAEIAMSYTIPVWRYGQNVVVEALGRHEGEDGFAVLHFRTREDLAARWAQYPEEARRGAQDAALFMDGNRGWSVTMMETLWKRDQYHE